MPPTGPFPGPGRPARALNSKATLAGIPSPIAQSMAEGTAISGGTPAVASPKTAPTPRVPRDPTMELGLEDEAVTVVDAEQFDRAATWDQSEGTTVATPAKATAGATPTAGEPPTTSSELVVNTDTTADRELGAARTDDSVQLPLTPLVIRSRHAAAVAKQWFHRARERALPAAQGALDWLRSRSEPLRVRLSGGTAGIREGLRMLVARARTTSLRVAHRALPSLAKALRGAAAHLEALEQRLPSDKPKD
ncbi:MAG: hypothetical protein KC416_04180 [Myxococcales bacterium]|nr:hypothetical protein [Myxococcales bacterium]